jgi:hypothetical protein
MAKIYSSACRTIVWLGEAPEDEARQFLEFLKRADEYLRMKGSNLVGWLENELTYDDLRICAEQGFRNPYFTRIWCVQEVQLSREVIVCYGPASLDWTRLRRVTDAARKIVSQRHYSGHVRKLLVCMLNAYLLFVPSEKDLSTLLVTYSGIFKASDPRDKVYGIVSLADPHLVTDLAVDYDKPVGEVYTDAISLAC